MKPTIHDSELMAFADGELDEETLRSLEERLHLDAAGRGKIDAVNEIGDIVRGHLELTSDAVPQKRFDALWREIDKGIDREVESARERDPSTAPATPARLEASRGAWSRMGRWFDRYRGHVLTGAVSAGAVAALALLLRNPGATEREIARTDGSAGGSTIAGTAPSERSAGSAGSAGSAARETMVTHQPTEIEALDTPDGTGTVFNLEDEDGNTTVIWVTPDDTVEGI